MIRDGYKMISAAVELISHLVRDADVLMCVHFGKGSSKKLN